jgi:hypothetical protein
MEGKYSEMCDGEMDYACICCSGAYESFDSITSVLESKKEMAKKIAEKVVEKEAESKGVEDVFEKGCERTPQEKLMDEYFEKLRVKMEADEIKKQHGSNAKLPCGLLKSGSATCQCAECCGEHSDDSVHSEDCLDLLTTTHV